MKDPIVEEVRRWRDQYAAQFGYDLAAICRDLREKQKESGIEVVSLPPRPVSPHFNPAAKKPA